MATVSSFLGLPPEILFRILELSPPSSLKGLRATCKHLKAIADPLLWHTIYLYPHLDRFRQIIALSMHPPVRNHCHQLVYDLRYAPILGHFKKRIENVYTSRASARDKAAAIERATAAIRGKLEPGRDDDIELLFLQDILRNLTLLESIIVLESNMDTNTGPDTFDIEFLPTYYQKIRQSTCGSLMDTDLEPGAYSLDGRTRSTKRVLVAAHGLGDRIKSLEIRNAHWDYIVAFEEDGKHLDLLKPFIGGLQSLTLRAFFNGDLNTSFLMRNLGIVLSLASKLKYLDICFGSASDAYVEDFSSDSEDDDQSRVPYSVLEMMGTNTGDSDYAWGTGLEHLVLSELCCRQSELIKLLKESASTLKNLEIGHFHLMDEKDAEADACLVSTLTDIRSILNLDTIWLYGDLRNSHEQLWSLNTETIFQPPKNTSPLLLERVLEWMLGAEPCPIQDLAVQKGCLKIQPRQFAAFERLTDASFQIHMKWGAEAPSVELGLSLPLNYSAWDEGVSPTAALYPEIDWEHLPLSP